MRFRFTPGTLAMSAALAAGCAHGPVTAPAPSNDTQTGCTLVAADLVALRAALESRPAPGSRICLADGSYRDADIRLVGAGTEGRPIVLGSLHPGGAVLSGTMHVAMGGSYLVLEGLRLEGGRSAGTNLIETRVSATELCDHCRVTEVSVTGVDAGQAADSKWIGLYGRHNRVDHCAFSGKSNPGALLVVWRRPGLPHQPEQDLIDHDLFADRPPLGENGAEAIRVGTSADHRSDSGTVVEDNLFEDFDGEIEIISSKSGGNVYRNNTFRRSAGLLTLRHGDGCTVEGNIFLAAGKAGAGGIRVVGARHQVIGNYIEGVRTTSDVRGGIVLMSFQDPARGPWPENGYQPVRDVVVARNIIVDSEQSLVFGGGKNGAPPEHVTIANNLVAAARGQVVREIAGLKDPIISGNVVGGAPLGTDRAAGFTVVDGPGLEAPPPPRPPLARADVGPRRYRVPAAAAAPPGPAP